VVDLARKAGRRGDDARRTGAPVRHEENGLITYDNPARWSGLDRILGDPGTRTDGQNGRRNEGSTCGGARGAALPGSVCRLFPELT